jgi:hypothetical protein
MEESTQHSAVSNQPTRSELNSIVEMPCCGMVLDGCRDASLRAPGLRDEKIFVALRSA